MLDRRSATGSSSERPTASMTVPTSMTICGPSSRRSSATIELLDLMMLCGWYHAISFTANAARVPREPGAPRFADVAP